MTDADLGWQVVPEIDVPAHSRAWGKGHPEIVTKCPKHLNSAIRNINRVRRAFVAPSRLRSSNVMLLTARLLGRAEGRVPRVTATRPHSGQDLYHRRERTQGGG